MIAAIFVSFVYAVPQVRGVGIVLSRYLGVDVATGIWAAVLVTAFIAVLGGMKGITWTQVAQYVVLITAYLIMGIALANLLTGNPIPQLAFTFSDFAVRLSELQVELGFKEYVAPFQNLSALNVFLITLTLMVGTAGLPHVIIRFYTVPKASDARWSAGWALVFIGLLYTTAPAVAVFSKYNLLNTLANKPVEEVRQIDWVQKWEQTGLLKLQDKNGDGILQMSGDPQVNEVTIDRDIIVLSTPEVAKLSPSSWAWWPQGPGRGAFHGGGAPHRHRQRHQPRPLHPAHQPRRLRGHQAPHRPGDHLPRGGLGGALRHQPARLHRPARGLRLRARREHLLPRHPPRDL